MHQAMSIHPSIHPSIPFPVSLFPLGRPTSFAASNNSMLASGSLNVNVTMLMSVALGQTSRMKSSGKGSTIVSSPHEPKRVLVPGGRCKEQPASKHIISYHITYIYSGIVCVCFLMYARHRRSDRSQRDCFFLSFFLSFSCDQCCARLPEPPISSSSPSPPMSRSSPAWPTRRSSPGQETKERENKQETRVASNANPAALHPGDDKRRFHTSATEHDVVACSAFDVVDCRHAMQMERGQGWEYEHVQYIYIYICKEREKKRKK